MYRPGKSQFFSLNSCKCFSKTMKSFLGSVLARSRPSDYPVFSERQCSSVFTCGSSTTCVRAQRKPTEAVVFLEPREVRPTPDDHWTATGKRGQEEETFFKTECRQFEIPPNNGRVCVCDRADGLLSDRDRRVYGGRCGCWSYGGHLTDSDRTSKLATVH